MRGISVHIIEKNLKAKFAIFHKTIYYLIVVSFRLRTLAKDFLKMAKLPVDAVVETWGVLIPGQAAKAKEIYPLVQKTIAQVTSGAGQGPWDQIKTQVQDVAGSGGLLGMLSAKRNRLVIEWSPYKIYVGSRAYGHDLDVNWNLTFEQGFFSKFLQDSTGLSLSSLNAFQVEDLRAFASLVHRGVTTAVDTIMQQAGLDTSKINKSTKGFLGI